MEQKFERKKLSLNKKTILKLNRQFVFSGGGTADCPTRACPTVVTCICDPGVTPNTKCIGYTTAPFTACAPVSE
jgi:hypothetical protein